MKGRDEREGRTSAGQMSAERGVSVPLRSPTCHGALAAHFSKTRVTVSAYHPTLGSAAPERRLRQELRRRDLLHEDLLHEDLPHQDLPLARLGSAAAA
jgi:hypothetical protein